MVNLNRSLPSSQIIYLKLSKQLMQELESSAQFKTAAIFKVLNHTNYKDKYRTNKRIVTLDIPNERMTKIQMHKDLQLASKIEERVRTRGLTLLEKKNDTITEKTLTTSSVEIEELEEEQYYELVQKFFMAELIQKPEQLSQSKREIGFSASLEIHSYSEKATKQSSITKFIFTLPAYSRKNNSQFASERKADDNAARDKKRKERIWQDILKNERIIKRGEFVYRQKLEGIRAA